jgi:F-type H+-transporting ATPase subunit b
MRSIGYSTAAGALAFGGSLLVAGTAFAAGGGMPQLNFKDFAPQVFWLAVLFVLLYLIMSKLAVPAISDTLEKRQAKIQADLDAAEKANDATREAVAAYEKRLADAREEARRLTRERSEADSAALAGKLAEVGERLGTQIGEAEKRIAAQRATVMQGLEDLANDIAASAYQKLAGQPADQGALKAKVAAAKGTVR